MTLKTSVKDLNYSLKKMIMKKSKELKISNRTQVFTNAKDNLTKISTRPLGEDFYNFNNDDTELDTKQYSNENRFN
jgi:hypothetical protein